MTRRYASAGAVVVTADLAEPRTLLLDQTRTNGERQTVAPKGRIEPGEGPLAAAIREVTEEAGVSDLAYAGYLGQEAYEFTDNDGTPAAKTVDWFLLTTTTAATDARAAEGFTAARWFTLDQALHAASHPSFVPYLRRAANVIGWRQDGPLPFSATLDHVVREISGAAQRLFDQYPQAGLAVCGSSARGDFVDGWSDIDLVGYGIPTGSATAEQLQTVVHDTASRFTVRVSLHLVDHSAHGAGPLHDMKLRWALRRIGIDTAVIAGATPAIVPPPPDPTEIAAGLSSLHDFAASHLARTATNNADRQDRARRALSVTCSAARIVALTEDPATDLRLPTVVEALAHRHPAASIVELLGAYDTCRRHEAGRVDTAERLADQAPKAIGDLIAAYRAAATMIGG